MAALMTSAGRWGTKFWPGTGQEISPSCLGMKLAECMYKLYGNRAPYTNTNQVARVALGAVQHCDRNSDGSHISGSPVGVQSL